MKTKKTLKALVLSLAMAIGMLLPATMQAQTDGFFRGGNDNYENRGDVTIPGNDESGISNYGIGETVPLGSGLLILTAVGAGYAISRRKRSRRDASNASNIALLSLALILGITSCKKNVETISSAATEGVFITLNVDDSNSGSKVIVNPTGHTNPDYATVTFEAGDIIYVGNNGAYCGYLEYKNSGNFEGTVTPSSEDDYLHFYFMGNKGEKSEPTSVNITDQTSKYPVISYAHSKTLYNSGTSSYTAKLQNYCAIVKFTTPNLPQATAITITGMNNTVEVNFAANNANPANPASGNPYDFSAGNGEITLHAESNTERWAILLPNNTATTSTAFAYGYAPDGTFDVPEITANTYYSTGITVSMTKVEFSVSDNTKVLFAPGNLQATYNGSSWSWQFAEHQWDYIGNGTSNTAINGSMTVSTNGTVDLFGWNGNSSSYDNYGIYNSVSTSDYGNATSEALKHDWGHNPITNGGNTADKWRTLTKGEWVYVFNNSKRGPNRFLKASITANSTTYAGVIIFPDNYDGSIGSYTYNNTSGYTTVSAQNWTDMENAGAVFLPAAGSRNGKAVNFAGASGYYWSSTSLGSNANNVYGATFSSSNFRPSNEITRCTGRSVRLVTALE